MPGDSGLGLAAVLSPFVALVSFLAGWFLQRRREERDRSYWQLSNVREYFFDEYLGENTNELRKQIADPQRKRPDDADPEWRLSVILQRVGMISYFGGLPLGYALASNAPQIVSDWLIIRSFVDQKVRQTNESGKAPFARRHAEWLALISWIWLQVQAYELSEKYRGDLDKLGTLYGGDQGVRQRENLLFEADRHLVSNLTKRIRRKILKSWAVPSAMRCTVWDFPCWRAFLMIGRHRPLR